MRLLRPIAACLITLCCAVPSVSAQRTATAEVTVRTMKEAGEPAVRAAGELRQRFRQDANAAAATMRAGGYAAMETVVALRDEYRLSGVDTYYALRTAGETSRSILDALSANGMRVRLDCIAPDGSPVPCGSFGGGSEQPAMSQVTWTPHDHGHTDSTLTIQGTGIPSVDVRIGLTTLTLLESSSTLVRARLPSTPVSGSLNLRRKSDGVVGELEPSYIVTTALNWSLYRQLAISAAIDDVRHWLSGAAVPENRCTIEGLVASGSMGALTSTTGFDGRIRTALLAGGAPQGIANAWDTAFQNAWTDWANAVTIPGLPWYPAFALYPDSLAPPTANVPTPLGLMISVNTLAMAPQTISLRIRGAIGAPATAEDAHQSIDAFGSHIAARLVAFLVKAPVVNVMGSGPVPSFAPPLVPAAPVSGGRCSGSNVLPTWSTF